MRTTPQRSNSRHSFRGPPPRIGPWFRPRLRQARPASTRSRISSTCLPSLQAVSTAAHQPRDVCLILDYSSSMRFQSLLGLATTSNLASNNHEPGLPAVRGLLRQQCKSAVHRRPPSPYLDANIDWTTSDGRPPIVQDFYTSSTGGAAFSAASASYATTPAGDVPLKTSKNTGGSYAQTLWGANGLLSTSTPTTSTRDATFESQGYKAYGMASKFNGYTQGPGYWGKTFLHLAARPHQRLALEVFHLFRRHARQFSTLGQQRQLASPRRQRALLQRQLQRHFEFHPQRRPQPLPIAAAIRPHRLLYVDPHHDRHLGLAAHRSQPAVLEGLHRLRAGIDANESPAATRSSTTAKRI